MEIYSFDRLASTQKYLTEEIEQGRLSAPVMVVAKEQDGGIGSRDNSWSASIGDLLFSFAIDISSLPDDLPLGSMSIYFSYLMKRVLISYSSGVWLKWPNDIYLGDHKIGGVITKKIDNVIVCGIGVNLQKSKDGFKSLNSDVSIDLLLEDYIKELELKQTWKQIFSEYQIEFELSRKFSVHIGNYHKNLKDALLCGDGSLIIEGKRVYSLR
ncbi:Biotin-protein ligase [hydrothermal vent metagenome]|uniref:Biotin-protein ligase n=1 Tax=hydrothermal vent metagenome TaxID=652676 RepID=A0A1W1C713_9ZZZZ